MIHSFSLRKNPFVFLQSDFSSSASYTAPMNSSSRSSFSNPIKKIFKKSPFIPILVIIFFVGIIAFVTVKGMTSQSPTVAGMQTQKRVDVTKPLAEQQLNRSFEFPLKDQTGKEVSKFTYMIQNIELRDQIVVKGQKATAVEGRVFLIINLKITNNYNKAISINSRDFLRLIINNSTEKLAADIHNDPVEVQAISTKYTRVAVAINKTDKNIVLQVGEITGKKDLINLDKLQ